MEINTRQGCPVHKVADALGDKWSLLILRNLLLDGRHRYQDLQNSLVGISPTTLSKRLKNLQGLGLIRRVVKESFPPATYYELTETGRQAGPMMRAIREFGDVLKAR